MLEAQRSELESQLAAAREETKKGAEELQAKKEAMERGADEVQLSRTALAAGAGELESQLVAARITGEVQAVQLSEGQARLAEVESKLAEKEELMAQLQQEKEELVAANQARDSNSAESEKAELEIKRLGQTLAEAEARIAVRLSFQQLNEQTYFCYIAQLYNTNLNDLAPT